MRPLWSLISNSFAGQLGDDDPKKSKLSKKDLDAANMFAKQFAISHGLMSGENANVGGVIPPFVDENGRNITGMPAQTPNVKLQTFVPPDIDELKEDNTGYPYFDDPQSGDPVHVPQNYRHLSRFNKNRGQYDKSIAKM